MARLIRVEEPGLLRRRARAAARRISRARAGRRRSSRERRLGAAGWPVSGTLRGRETPAPRGRRGRRRRTRRRAPSGAKWSMKRARNGPTLTQVPVDSLKSSAMRPSNSRPLAGSCRVDEFQRVAEFVEALVVEGLAGQVVLPPIARRDVRPAQPRFELALVRHQLEFDARRRQADIARPIEVPGAGERERCGFGRAERRQENNALARRLDRELRSVDPMSSGSGRRRHRTAPSGG